MISYQDLTSVGKITTHGQTAKFPRSSGFPHHIQHS